MDERLRAQARRAAEVYDRAVTNGQRPAAAVGRELGLPRSTASRRIRLARDLGLLPAAGPHRAVTAEIHRGQPDAFKIRVCVTCITRWPCAAAPG